MVGNLARWWGIGLLVGDVVLTCLSLFIADWARRDLPIGDPVEIERFIRAPIYLAVCILWPVALRAFGAYDTRRTRALADEVGAVVPGVAVASLALVGFFYVFEFRFISRLLLAYFVALDLVLLVNVRLVARLTMTWLRSEEHTSELQSH